MHPPAEPPPAGGPNRRPSRSGQPGGSGRQGGQQPGQPARTGQTGQAPPTRRPQQARPPAPADMSVATPTLHWVTISNPGVDVPLGHQDYVLDAHFDPGTNVWNVLVLVQPEERRDEDSENDRAE